MTSELRERLQQDQVVQGPAPVVATPKKVPQIAAEKSIEV